MNQEKKNDCVSGCKHIKGINCSVKSCYYHDGETYCTADQIAVSSANAKTSSETACATFKPNHCDTCH